MIDTGPDAAGIDQPAIGVVIGEQQRPEPGPRAFGIGPAGIVNFPAGRRFPWQPVSAQRPPIDATTAGVRKVGRKSTRGQSLKAGSDCVAVRAARRIIKVTGTHSTIKMAPRMTKL